jgi:hypothetical protein
VQAASLAPPGIETEQWINLPLKKPLPYQTIHFTTTTIIAKHPLVRGIRLGKVSSLYLDNVSRFYLGNFSSQNASSQGPPRHYF